MPALTKPLTAIRPVTVEYRVLVNSPCLERGMQCFVRSESQAKQWAERILKEIPEGQPKTAKLYVVTETLLWEFEGGDKATILSGAGTPAVASASCGSNASPSKASEPGRVSSASQPA